MVRLSPPNRRPQDRFAAAGPLSRREVWRLFSLLLAVAMVGFLIREFNRPQVAAQVDRAMGVATERVSAELNVAPRRENQPADPAQFSKLLELAGWDAKRLASVESGPELTDDQREELAELLWRLKSFEGPQLIAWAKAGPSMAALAADPKANVGDLVHLAGRVTKVERRELPAELAERLEMASYYKCEIELDADAGMATISTARVPAAWLEMPTLNEPATAAGVLIKSLAADGAKQPGLFISGEITWQPTQPQPPFVSLGESVLGTLGIDVGLLDSLRQRSPLSGREREAFYQVLDAVGRIGANQLARFASQDLATVQKRWAADEKRLAESIQRDTTADPRVRAQLQLAHEVQTRAAAGQFSVAPLFNQPEQQVGELIVLDGTVRRATRIDVGKSTDGGESDVARRFGIDHYYELDVFTEDSQNNPVMFCVRELPSGFPLGDGLHEPVRIAGFFLKSWSFESRRATLPQTADGSPTPANMRQFAPLLVGRGPIILDLDAPANSAYFSYIAAALFVLGLAGIWMTGWWFARDERRLRGETLATRYALPEGESLNDLDLDLSPATPKNE